MNYVKFIRLTLKHNKCSYGPKNKKAKNIFPDVFKCLVERIDTL